VVLYCHHKPSLQSPGKLAIIGLGAYGNNISKSSSKEQFGLHPQVLI
jgi:hypothetical protein